MANMFATYNHTRVCLIHRLARKRTQGDIKMMKKKILLALLPLMLCVSCGRVAKSWEFNLSYFKEVEGWSSEDERQAELDGVKDLSEIVRKYYLAICKRGANECAIEISQSEYDKGVKNYKLTHTGYIIVYHIYGDMRQSNNGWERV